VSEGNIREESLGVFKRKKEPERKSKESGWERRRAKGTSVRIKGDSLWSATFGIGFDKDQEVRIVSLRGGEKR